MVYDSKKEALESRIKFMNTPKNNDEFSNHRKKWDFLNYSNNRKMGKYFLYEKEQHDKIYYPQLGVYLNDVPCDQTIEVEWVNYRRSCEWRIEYNVEYEDKDGLVRKWPSLLAEDRTEIETLIIWDDYLLVYGMWDSFPSYMDLKRAYENTWWFYKTIDEKRDLNIERILR